MYQTLRTFTSTFPSKFKLFEWSITIPHIVYFCCDYDLAMHNNIMF